MAATATTQNNPAGRFFQSGTALNRVLMEAPYLPRCSEDKTATRIRPREYALRYPYMQVNRPGFVSWLIFDLDHPQAMIWEDAALPAPNLIVRNRASGHSHLYYAIIPVCTSENARSKPIAYMKAIYAAFAVRLDADPDFHSGPVAKTPGHPWWLTHELHSRVYELGELADYVELAVASPWGREPQCGKVSHSRHCTVFEQLRHYAYSIVNRERAHGSFSSFTRLLEAFAHNENRFRTRGFSEDLPASSLRATVKSVARWTWDRYRGCGRCHRGVMQLDPALPLLQRQRLAAARTHELRRKATESKLRAACRLLQEKGEALTQTAIGRVAGLTRQTVAAYPQVLDQAPKAASVAVPEVAAATAGDVKHGVHQVTAVPSAPLLGAAAVVLGLVLSDFLIASSRKALWASPQDLSTRPWQAAPVGFCEESARASPRSVIGAGEPDLSAGVAATARRSFDDETLGGLRAIPLSQVLERLRDDGHLFWRCDLDFKPQKDARTLRVYVSSATNGSAWELLLTGQKWFDTRARKGGGGGIDLTMHLLGIDFVKAVKLLAAAAASAPCQRSAVRHG